VAFLQRRHVLLIELLIKIFSRIGEPISRAYVVYPVITVDNLLACYMFNRNLSRTAWVIHRDAKRSAGASRSCDRSQNGRSSASCRASIAVTPVSRQNWWFQVVDGPPHARLHSCEGRSPSLVLVQICIIWL